jgi:hypothetical protein
LYCHECGAKSTPGTSFCAECGTRLLTSEEEASIRELGRKEAAASLELGAGASTIEVRSPTGTKAPGKPSVFMWLIPLLLLGTVSLSLFLYNSHEIKVNDQVDALHQQAGKEALEGRYSEAVKLLDSAAAKRPGYDAIRQDRAVVAEAAEFQGKLKEAAAGLSAQKLQASEASLKAIASALEKRQEPVFASVKKELAASQVKLAVMKVKSELDKLSTVEALADKLQVVEELEGQEAAAIKKQILSKLAGISYSDAEKKLQDKDYAGALQAVDNGLFYAMDEPKLTAFRERIASEKKSFEQAEQERIELARQQAAQEDLDNRTAAVEVSGLEAILDEYGDLEVRGVVTNRATRPIYSINLSVDIYNNAGDYVGETYASVFPYELAPGESGEFTTSYYGVYEQVQVYVVDANWYLE